MKDIKEIELIHPGGTCETVPVETINRDSISIRWGMSGVYDIDLKLNVIKSRSVKARRKGVCYWKVKDMDKLKALHYEYWNDSRKRQIEIDYEKHTMNMPRATATMKCK